MPISERMLKKKIKTVAIATIPKSLGDINLARIAVIASWTTKPEYFAIAVNAAPVIKSFLQMTSSVFYCVADGALLLRPKSN